MAVIFGGVPDRVPFAPFAELMPRGAFEREMRERGMGLVVHHSSVQEKWRGIRETREERGNTEIRSYATEKGEARVAFTYENGVSNTGSVQSEYMIKGPGDYPAAIAYIDSAEYRLDAFGNTLLTETLGDDGILHAWSFEPPYMGAQYYLGYENWVYHQLDHPSEFAVLMDALGRAQERRMQCVAMAPESIVNIANLSGNFGPAEFEKRMLPYIARHSRQLSQRGKKSTLHADASNLRQFKELIGKSGVDIVEAFTPPPVGDLSLREARECWGPGMTIWVNFPETLFYEGYESTRRYTVELLKSDPCPNKLLGFTEMGLMGATGKTGDVFREGIAAIMDAIDEAGRYGA